MTRPLIFTGGTLLVNADAGGSGQLTVTVEPVVEQPVGQPGVGITSRAFVGNAVNGTVEWSGGAAACCSNLAGTPVRLRFLLRRAELYSFRFIK